MRIVMMGTGGFAVPAFRSLVESDHEVVALFTRPTKANTRRRGKQLRNPMRETAEELGVGDVRVPESANSHEAIRELHALQPDLLVVCDYGQILSAAALTAAPLGGINLHGSLLPAYRGAAPINWALYNGEPQTGVTVIHMTPRLDAGPCLVRQAIAIGPQENAVELEERLAHLGVGPLHQAIDMLARWDRSSPLGQPQDPTRSTRAPRLKKTDGAIDWSRTSQQIFDQVRAFKPWPGTYTYCLRAHQPALRLQLESVTPGKDPPTDAKPGDYLSDGDQLTITTGGGTLRLDYVKPEGRKLVSGADFLHGHPLQPGDRMGPLAD